MNVVFGASGLARALAYALQQEGPTVLASRTPVVAALTWRRACLATGEGVLSALKDATTAYVVVQPEEEVAGAGAIIKPLHVSRGLWVLESGGQQPSLPDRLPGWSTLRLGPTWGARHAWAQAWAAEVQRGRTLWVPRVNPVRVVPEDVAVAAMRAAVQRKAVRWSLPGGSPRDVAALARDLFGDVSMAMRALPLAAWRVGMPAQDIRDMVEAPRFERETGSWTGSVGRAPMSDAAASTTS